MTVRVGCIVEGHGEVRAVPVLIRRVARTLGVPVDIPHPIRIPGSKLAQQGELERAVELASRTIGGRGAILVLRDSDDDCPAEVGRGCWRAPSRCGGIFQWLWCWPRANSRLGSWRRPNRFGAARGLPTISTRRPIRSQFAALRSGSESACRRGGST